MMQLLAKMAINSSNHAVFKMLYLLDRVIYMYIVVESHFAYLQSGPVSIEVQKWFNLQCIVPKILRGKISQGFVHVLEPAKSCLLLGLEYLRNDASQIKPFSVDIGPLCKYAKCDSTILHNQGDTVF